MTAESTLSAVLGTLLVGLFYVVSLVWAFRSGYLHARTLHDIAGGEAGDRLLRQHAPGDPMLPVRREENQ